MTESNHANRPDAVDTAYPFIGRHLGHKITVTLAAIIPFALTIFAIVQLWGSHVTWLDLGLLFILQATAGIGITLGFHRLLAHGAYKASAPVRFVLLLMGVTALQGGPAAWAATHRRHHARADQPGDPHSPLEGFWHAHFGWLPKGNLVHKGPAHAKLMQDPVVAFLERTQLLWIVLSFIVPGAIAFAVMGTWGAFWQAVLWGGVVRVFLVHHVTWSINSVCHTWGTRPYASPDVARNNAIFGVLGFGEGWHNNHHAFPKSAYLGHRWYQFDIGRYILVVLRALGLVRDVKVPSREERRARSAKAAAGTTASG